MSVFKSALHKRVCVLYKCCFDVSVPISLLPYLEGVKVRAAAVVEVLLK